MCFPFFVRGLGKGWFPILTTGFVGLLICKGDLTHCNRHPAEPLLSP